MNAIPPQYIYTSRREVENVISQVGVNLRLDDLDTSDSEDALEEYYIDATLDIDTHAQHYYESSDLATSSWVRRRATYLACYYLSQRRGNPALFQLRYNQIMEQLERVQLGEMLIPGLPTRADMTPAMSNMVVDERFILSKLRVHPSISTGGTGSRQHLSYIIPFEWL